MFWNLMLMQVRPWAIWIRFYLGMCLPIVVYLQNMTGIIIVVVLLLGLKFLPRPSVISRIDFSYHAIRGLFLEVMGEAKLDSPIVRFFIGSMIMKIIVMITFVGVLVYSIYVLWNQRLLLGSLLFYGMLALKICIFSEFSNISKNMITNDKWSVIIEDEKK